MALNRNNLKQTPIPVVPRTMQLVNPDGTVTRSGQLLLQQLQAPDAMQGTNAGRPDPGQAPDGALYFESDRGVIYSNTGGKWYYVAGTMWGTISPDQRPTDLGVNDGGFAFRTTDDPAREFIWSQTAWIEVTPVRYGTHASRLAVNLSGVIDQMLWVETDRGDVLYQTQNHAWQFVAGTMFGTLSPDQRPSDLGANDAGFLFETTDTYEQYRWSGSAWAETTPANDLQVAYASGNLTLIVNSSQDVPGATLTLRRAGLYWIWGVYYFNCVGADSGNYFLGQLWADGTVASNEAVFQPTYVSGGGGAVTAAQQWPWRMSAPNKVVKLQAYKNAGTGTSTVVSTHTSIGALWISP